MAITSGFFNSLDGDRKYDARQMSEIFDGVILDGVFMSIGDALKTVPSSGMTVAVGSGRAWFLHTWTKNDSDYLITVSSAESVLNRIDTIVLDVDNTESVRANTIKLIKGTPASDAKRPVLINTEDHKQIPLADILIPAGATALTATNITNIVGTEECPYVTGPLSVIKNDDIVAAWQEEFDTWFEDVKGTLGSDTAGNLYNLIQQKVDKTDVVDSEEEISLVTESGKVAGALAVKSLGKSLRAERVIERSIGYRGESGSFENYKKIDVASGTVVVRPNGSSAILASQNTLRSWFNDDSLSVSRVFAFVMNGDAAANLAHVDGVSVQGTDLRAVFDRSTTNSIRLNFIMFYVHQ